MPHCSKTAQKEENATKRQKVTKMMTSQTEKARIPNEYLMQRDKIVQTKNYGELNELQIYFAYYLPKLIKRLQPNVGHLSKIPYKISIEIDENKLKAFSESEQQFYKDSVKMESLG